MSDVDVAFCALTGHVFAISEMVPPDAASRLDALAYEDVGAVRC